MFFWRCNAVWNKFAPSWNKFAPNKFQKLRNFASESFSSREAPTYKLVKISS